MEASQATETSVPIYQLTNVAFHITLVFIVKVQCAISGSELKVIIHTVVFWDLSDIVQASSAY